MLLQRNWDCCSNSCRPHLATNMWVEGRRRLRRQSPQGNLCIEHSDGSWGQGRTNGDAGSGRSNNCGRKSPLDKTVVGNGYSFRVDEIICFEAKLIK